MQRSETIKRFLSVFARNDLAILYDACMEVQVNVAQDGGERVENDFKGAKWHGWTDGISTWKSFRMPLKANSVPEPNDTEVHFDFEKHVEAIGMTGWDYVNKVSRWVAFDFDSLTNHKKGLTDSAIEKIIAQLSGISWVTIRKSTSGVGIHIYVLLPDVPTQNHSEHAALARAILSYLSALTGVQFENSVDICGGNMWVWHRKGKGNPNSLQIIKSGDTLRSIPHNWQAHVPVIQGKKKRATPQVVPDAEAFETLTSTYTRVALDDTHRKIMDELNRISATWWWDQDNYMLVAHTNDLKTVHTNLKLAGVFETASTGSSEYNCYAFPTRQGSFVVRRFSAGVKEADTWEQDGKGWTRCFFNKIPDLKSIAKSFKAIESTKGGFVFESTEKAKNALDVMGFALDMHECMKYKQATLSEHKDGRIIIKIAGQDSDNGSIYATLGFMKEKRDWVKILNVKAVPESNEQESENYDDIVRHIITEQNEDAGWVINIQSHWCEEPLTHVKSALESLGYSAADNRAIIGSSVFKAWKVVSRPFQPEYAGDRTWNRQAPQLRFQRVDDEVLSYPTWLSILRHLGKNLDMFIACNKWCKQNGILTGADYLKCWIASVIKNPLEPLPYLFFYGRQNNGKTIFHEAIAKLMSGGVVRADAALISQSGFNSELKSCVLAVVEETDLDKNKQAYNRIKDWVTSQMLPIHAKGATPYSVPNTTHWVQCANEIGACPVFPGDTRITVISVDALDPLALIPKRVMLKRLEDEAAHFTTELLNLEVPFCPDRLRLPVIETPDKAIMENRNRSPIEQFIESNCYFVDGHSIAFSTFYDSFYNELPMSDRLQWSKRRVASLLPAALPYARHTKDCQMHIGNISFDKGAKPAARYFVKNSYLVQEGAYEPTQG